MLGRTHRYVGLLAASASFIPIKNICLSGHDCSWPLSDLASYQAYFIKSFISLGDNHKEYLTYLFYNNYMPIFWVSLMGFCIGGLSHLVADMLSGSVPWGFYGKYYDRFSRFGITIFLPKSIHGVFTKKIPTFIEKYSFILLIVTIATGAYAIYEYKFDFLFSSILK